MAERNPLKNIIELTEAEYKVLEETGTITVEGITLTYDQFGTIYATEESGGVTALSITITAPENAAQGTLTTEQLNVLTDNENAYIKLNNEIFVPQDRRINNGYLIYSHLSHENTQTFYVKCITITIGELTQAAWTLTSLQLPSPVLPLMASDFLLDEHNGNTLQSIYYDETHDCVELGTCIKDEETGELTYTKSDPIATRAESSTFTNGNLVKWDATNNKFVDSGISTPGTGVFAPDSYIVHSNSYDEVKLIEHAEEIFSYVNVENGGSLISIGFKIDATDLINTTAKIIQFNSDGTNTVSEGSVSPFTPGDYIQASVEHIDADTNSIYLRCGINPLSNAIIALKRIHLDGGTGTEQYTYSATLSNNQINTNTANNLPIITYYNDVDISTMLLEHLTITYYLPTV